MVDVGRHNWTQDPTKFKTTLCHWDITPACNRHIWLVNAFHTRHRTGRNISSCLNSWAQSIEWSGVEWSELVEKEHSEYQPVIGRSDSRVI